MQFVEEGDYQNSEQSIVQLVNLLNSASASLTESQNDDSESISVQILTQLQQYLDSPPVTQAVYHIHIHI